MRKITPRQYAISLYESVATAEQSALSGILKRFVALLAEHQQLSQADKIIKAFRRYLHEQEGIVAVTTTTATPLDHAHAEEITAALKQALHKEIELETVVDPAIMGGIVVRYGDHVADGSIRSRLEALGEHLKK